MVVHLSNLFHLLVEFIVRPLSIHSLICYLSACPSICLFYCPSIFHSFLHHLYFHLLFCPFIHSFIPSINSLSVCPLISFPIYLFLCPSFHLSIYFHQFILFHLFVCPSIHSFVLSSTYYFVYVSPSIHSFVCPFICPSVHPSFFHPFIHSPFSFSYHSSFVLFIHPSIHPTIHSLINPPIQFLCLFCLSIITYIFYVHSSVSFTLSSIFLFLLICNKFFVH